MKLLVLLAVLVCADYYVHAADEEKGLSGPIYDYELFKTVHKIQGVIKQLIEQGTDQASKDGDRITVSYAPEEDRILRNRWNQRTAQGVVLDFDGIIALRSPWGRLYWISGITECYGLGTPPMEIVHKNIIQKLGLKEYKESPKRVGSPGPFYAICEVEGIVLPNPAELTTLEPEDDAEYEKARVSWEKLKERYKSERAH